MKRNSLWSALCVLSGLILFTLAGCGGGGGGGTPVPSQAALTVAPLELTFNAAQGDASAGSEALTVSNTGAAGSTLDWVASISEGTGGAWLSISPSSGALATGQSADIVLLVQGIGDLAQGAYNKTVTVGGVGTPQQVVVTLNIGSSNQQATVGVAPTGLAFAANINTAPSSQNITISNSGSAPLVWSADSSQFSWLSISPSEGTIAPGLNAAAAVSVTAQAQAGTHNGTITISADNTSNSPQTVTVAYTVSQPAQSAQTGKVFVGGSAGITQISGLVGGSLKKASTAPPQALTNAKVTIAIIKPDGSKKTQATFTDAQGSYAAEIDAQEGDTITVTFEKDGFSSYSKTVRVRQGDLSGEGNRRQVTVTGNVTQATVIVAQKSDEGIFKASGGTAPGFRFGLMRSSSGERRPFGDPQELRAASADEIPELELQIPASWAPDATAVTARLAGFDPAIPEERRMFPGEFVGVGGAVVSRASDAGEYALESISFFEANVTPNTGQPLTPPQGTGLAKANADPVIIYRWIPSEGCEAMKKYTDRDGDASNGVQVPIYTYRPDTGKWGYLGEGTLKTWNGDYVTVPVATVTGANDKLSGLNCGGTEYYFQIVAENWTAWWNLDYPLLFAQPRTVLVSGRVVDGGNQPIAGAFIEADGYRRTGGSYFYTYSGNDGRFELELLLGDNETADNYLFTAYSWATWPAAQKEFTPPAAGGEVGDITLSDGLDCRIQGKLVEGSNGVSGAWINAYANDWSFSNWLMTDAAGAFSTRTVCNKPITFEAGGLTTTANVNGLSGSAELSDDGTVVDLKDLVRVNLPPQVSTWFWPEPVRAGRTVTLEAWSYDYEGDYPLTSQLVVKDAGDNPVFSTDTGSDWLSAQWAAGAAGIYTVEVTATDSKSNSKTVVRNLEVVDDANNRPIISWTWVQPGSACGLPVLYVSAYDPDGDSLTYAFSSGAPTFSSELGGWVTTTDPGTEVVVTVSDGKGGTAESTLQIPAASGLELYYAEAWPNPAVLGDEIYLYAYAWQSDGSPPTYTWTVEDPSGMSVTTTPESPDDNSFVFFTPDATGEYSVILTVSGACDEAISRNFTIAVEPLVTVPADTEVIIR